MIIVGDGKVAEIAHALFTDQFWRESDGSMPSAFVVEAKHRTRDRLFGLPVLNLEDLPNGDDDFFVGVASTQLNRLRTRLYETMKAKGYRPTSYWGAYIKDWDSDKIGEHAWVMAFNNIDPFVTIGNNVMIWAHNHIGHHSVIGDNVFIASGVTISGSCRIGNNSFIGVNAAIGDGVTIGEDCMIGAGALVVRDVPPNTFIKAQASPVDSRTAREFWKVQDAALA